MRRHYPHSGIAHLISVLVIPILLFVEGQENKATVLEKNTSNGNGSSFDSNAALLWKPEAMRPHIQWLSVQLKTKSGVTSNVISTGAAAQLQEFRATEVQLTQTQVVVHLDHENVRARPMMLTVIQRQATSHESPADASLLDGKRSSSVAQLEAAQAPAGNSTTGGNFFGRLTTFYRQDWSESPQNTTPTARNALPAPLDSLPFPNADWGYGGSPDIGASDGNVYPLMTALKLKNARTKIYGWIEPSINFSTSGTSNFPVSYDILPNKIELNQAVVYVERLPDTVQKAHFDYGYHFTAFYGTDYRFTTAKDYFSQQLLKFNRQYGFDPVLEYLDLYFPVKEGLNIRIGRFLSVPGIEAQLAPNNYNMTHSLLYTIDPFTDTGIFGTLKIAKQWIVQLGLSASHDIAPWSDDRRPSAIACLDYSTADNDDNFYACANGINSGKYAYNNLQDYDGTWYHKFNAKWHMATEAWYMYERDVPNVAGNVTNPVTIETGANGAYCNAGSLRCTAPEYAAVSYLNREVDPKLFVGFRSDLLNDKKGQRTGLAGKYTENTLYATKYIGSTMLFRPELRFDHSWDRRGYNAGKSRNQLFFGMDMIYKF